jgi:hemerythrin-like metal-binding protein
MKPDEGFDIRNRPDWLYNSLPYVYIGIGLVVAASLGASNLIGVFSGILLISTGGAIVTMRTRNKQELAKLRAEFAESERRLNDRRKNDRRESNDESAPLGFFWKKEYESGNSIMDEQHLRLHDLSNKLLNAMLSRKRPSEISILLNSYLEQVQQHFLMEEEILSKTKHPITIEHKTEHDNLLFHANRFVSKYGSGKMTFNDISEFSIFKLIAGHIATEDKQYSAA